MIITCIVKTQDASTKLLSASPVDIQFRNIVAIFYCGGTKWVNRPVNFDVDIVY